MLAVGLTGDVGAGKSTLSSIWGSFGARVLDADAIVAEIWKSKEMVSLAVQRWGKRILSDCGMPDHAVISGIVFGNDDEYLWVCKTLHPRVRAEMASMAEKLDGWVVAEIPLLFENGIPDWIDLTVYIEAPEDIRVSRNRQRGWGRDEIFRRESRLMDRSQKIVMADFVVANVGSLEDLTLKAGRLARRFIAASSLFMITVTVPSEEKTRLVSSSLKGSGLAAGIVTSPGGSGVSAFVREESIEKMLSIFEDADLSKDISIEKEKTRKAPRNVLLWAMGSAQS